MLQAAQKLIDLNVCTEAQLAEWGGFFASVNLKPRKAYFAICGQERYYVDLTTMEVFQ